MFSSSECRDVLLPLLTDQLSGQLDDHSSKPDHEASSQLLSNILEVLDRKDVVSGVILQAHVPEQVPQHSAGETPRSPVWAG
jgi:hypothetical protein